MNDLLRFVEALPPVPLYAAIAVLAGVENIFPPVPADTVVAFGAFLAGRGTLDAWTVFGLTWTANTATATATYLLGRHYGRPFFEGPLGRRLLSAETLGHVERAYERHGVYGIFVARLLPVWRALVPPFAGMARVSPGRALVPLALASGVWYGALTYLVTTLGTNFQAVTSYLARVNLVLGLLAITAVLVIAFLVRRSLRRPPVQE